MERELGLERADVLSQTTSERHRKGQRSPQAVQRAGDCSIFFRIQGFFGFFTFGLDGLGFGFQGR